MKLFIRTYSNNEVENEVVLSVVAPLVAAFCVAMCCALKFKQGPLRVGSCVELIVANSLTKLYIGSELWSFVLKLVYCTRQINIARYMFMCSLLVIG